MGFVFNPLTGQFDKTAVTPTPPPIAISQQAFVDANGNDSTGIVGSLNNPFLTIAGAEGAISDAASNKRYLINIGPGSFDVTGLSKKSYINWAGAGKDTTFLTVTSGNLDLTNPGMSASSSEEVLSDMTISCPISADLFSVGGASQNQYLFINCSISGTQSILGRGASQDFIEYYDCSLTGTPSTWDSVGMNVYGGIISGGSTNNYTASNGLASSFLFTGVLGSSTANFQAATEFLIAGMVGSFFNLIQLNGPSVVGIIDAGSSQSDPVVSNSATIQYLAAASRMAYVPGTSGNWTVPPALVQAALDAIAAGTVFPPQWNVNGTITATKSVTDSGAQAAQFTVSSHTTIDGSNTTIATDYVASGTVDAGTTNDKGVSGIVNTVTRGDGTDDGTLDNLVGTASLLFHNSGAAGHTTKTYGSQVSHFLQKGIQDTIYDYFSETVPAGTGVATAHYGLYLGSDPTVTKQNWVSGNTRLGGTSFSAPAESLDVNGNVLAGIFKGTQLGINQLTPQAAIHVGALSAGTVDATSIILGSVGASANVGPLSTILGQGCSAAGNASLAGGNGNTASGTYSTAFGDQGVASGASSLSGGQFQTASGDFSFSYGNSGVASGSTSVAFGFGCVAGGLRSFCLGNQSSAPGINAIASGDRNLASGDNSFSGGSLSQSTAAATFSYGTEAFAAHAGAHTIADSQSFVTTSTAADQFKARFQGGFTFAAGGGADTVDGDLLSIKGSHLISKQTTAPVAFVQGNAGIGSTASVNNATDCAGAVTLVTSGIGASGGGQVIVSFDKPYNITPIVQLTPASSAAGVNMSPYGIYVTASVNDFTIVFTNPDSVGNTYHWYYQVIETQ